MDREQNEESNNSPLWAVFFIFCPPDIPPWGPLPTMDLNDSNHTRWQGPGWKLATLASFVHQSDYSLFWRGFFLFCPLGMHPMEAPTHCGPLPLSQHQMTESRMKTCRFGKFCASMGEKSNYCLFWATMSTTCYSDFPTSSLSIFKYHEWKLIYIKFLIQWWKLHSSISLRLYMTVLRRHLSHS